MLLSARLTDGAQALLHAEAKSTTTCLSNMLWNAQVKGIPNVLFNGTSGNLCPEHLIEFGCISYIQIKRQVNSKCWVEKSTKCIMVSYANDHSADTYRMYDPQTNTVCLTCNVHWANWKHTDPATTLDIFQKDELIKNNSPVGAAEEDQPPLTMLHSPPNQGPHLIPALIDEVGRNELLLQIEPELDLKARRTHNATGKTQHPKSVCFAPATPAQHGCLTHKLHSLKKRDKTPTPVEPTVEQTSNESTLPMEPSKEQTTVNLALNHGTELLCFMMELSSNPGKPKTLHEALEGLDAQ